MRQYWIPGLLSTELSQRDGRPLRLLGENLVALRDSEGRVGVVADNWPHRGASLFFGRNEEEGLRCVYHGWKFDVSGQCVDMPNEPPEWNFKDKVHAFPFYTMIPTGVLGLKIGVRAWVPIDDDHTMFWNMYTPSQRYGLEGRARQPGAARDAGAYMAEEQYLPNTTDWLGRWRLKANAGNDYLLDPDAQRKQTYTGIAGIHIQDQAITESMGTLMDRTNEHLGTADVMIIRTRQRLIKAAEALKSEGAVPPGVDNPEVFAVRTGSAFLPKGADWLEATEELRKAFVDHPELLEQAEAGRF